MSAVAGDLPVGQALLDSFRKEPWLGFEVVGVYNDAKPGGVTADWAGNYQQLIEDARTGKIHNVYLALKMSEETCIKYLMRELADTTCSVILISDVFTFNILHSRIEEVNGVQPIFGAMEQIVAHCESYSL